MDIDGLFVEILVINPTEVTDFLIDSCTLVFVLLVIRRHLLLVRVLIIRLLLLLSRAATTLLSFA